MDVSEDTISCISAILIHIPAVLQSLAAYRTASAPASCAYHNTVLRPAPIQDILEKNTDVSVYMAYPLIWTQKKRETDHTTFAM